MSLFSIAVIGSFRQHYKEVLDAWRAFESAGIHVSSPKGSPIVTPGIPFVRFQTDPEPFSDSVVQTIALHRILRSRLVFVVAPEGYVGRTTCYEIGRIIQARKPIYFSAYPIDLPIHVPEAHILSASELVEKIVGNDWKPEALFSDLNDANSELERDLLDGRFRED